MVGMLSFFLRNKYLQSVNVAYVLFCSCVLYDSERWKGLSPIVYRAFPLFARVVCRRSFAISYHRKTHEAKNPLRKVISLLYRGMSARTDGASTFLLTVIYYLIFIMSQ